MYPEPPPRAWIDRRVGLPRWMGWHVDWVSGAQYRAEVQRVRAEALRRRRQGEDRASRTAAQGAPVSDGEAQRASSSLRSWLVPAYASSSSVQCGWPVDSIPLLSVGCHVRWVEPGHMTRIPSSGGDAAGGASPGGEGGDVPREFKEIMMPPWHSRGLKLAAITFPTL